jgi:hypothetical protein
MEISIKSAAFILNYSEDYVVRCLAEGKLKSLLFSDIIECKNNDFDRREECLNALAKLEEEFI